MRHVAAETAKGVFTVIWFTLAGVVVWAVVASLPTALTLIVHFAAALWRLI